MDIKTADRLVKYRKQKGLSQEELADALKVSRQAISKWERGETSPDTDNLIALAKIYGVTIDELINGEAEVTKKVPEAEPEKATKKEEDEDDDEDEDEKLTPKQKLILSITSGAGMLVCTLIYFVIGFCLNMWHPTWIVFMLFPVLMSLVDAIIKRKFNHFAYPVLVAAVYLLVGFLCDLWHPLWILFLTIPIYYIFVDSFAVYKANKK